MRKFLFFLLLLPALVALGHDVYMYTENQEKGFELSDLGALWDKYHKESHDQWKIKLKEYEGVVGDLVPAEIQNTLPVLNGAQSDVAPAIKTGYQEDFTQASEKGKDSVVTALKLDDSVEAEPSGVQRSVGFILEQKAVFVFASFAAIIIVLTFVLGFLFRGKTSADEVASLKKGARKGGGYKYNRK